MNNIRTLFPGAGIRRLADPENRSLLVFTLISGVTVLVFAGLAFLFPYTGDDWAWGSSISIPRLETFFDGYNGRYFGNFVIMAISRSKALKVAVMALSYYAACLLCYKYTPVRKNATLVFAVVLFFLMPRTVFQQSVVWASGYANYVPSALLSVAYLLLVRNITGEELPQYPKFLWILTFLMGFCGAPFIENIALFNICLGIAVTVYTAIRFKKLYAAHIGFLLGAILGACWMFSNSAYTLLVNNGSDGYRTVALGLKEIVSRCLRNAETVCDQLIGKNYTVCAVASTLLFLLTLRFIRQSESKAKRIGTGCAMAVNAVCLFFVICRSEHVLSIDAGAVFSVVYTGTGLMVFSVLYALSVFAGVMLCVPKGRRFRMLLPFYCIPVVVAPLLFVTPIGPRCFFVSYLLMMVFVVDLFGYITKNLEVGAFDYKAVLCSLVAVAVLQAAVCVSIFLPIYRYDARRSSFARLQSEQQEEEIVICSLPNEQYLWVSSPTTNSLARRYKLFYGLREDAKLTVVTPEEFDAYCRDYQSP